MSEGTGSFRTFGSVFILISASIQLTTAPRPNWVLFGTYRRSQCLFLQVYIIYRSGFIPKLYSKTASLVSIRNLHIGKNAFTKLCSCWTKKDPLLMRHPPLGFFIALHYWEPLCACLLNRLNLLGLKCSGPLASKSKTCSEACSCPAPATLQHNISPGVLQKK